MDRCRIWDDEELVLLYAFADRFLVPDLKPAVMELLVKHFNNYPVPNSVTIAVALENLPSQSPVLRLLVDTFCLSWDPEVDHRDEVLFDDLPLSFLRLAMMKYASNVLDRNVMLETKDYQEVTDEEGDVHDG